MAVSPALIAPTHALLITQRPGSHLKPALRAYCQTVVCAQRAANRAPCGACAPCIKVAGGNYYDYVDVAAKDALSKERVIEIQNRFARGALEQAGKKIYVLRQIERASPQAVNALLLFLEEPPANTYAVLTTRNESAVPATIVSRCMRVALPRADGDWDGLAAARGLKPDDLRALRALYWCVDDAEAALEDASFPRVAEVARGFMAPRRRPADAKALYDRFRALPQNDVAAVIGYLTAALPPERKGHALELSDALRLNPIKSALFWRLLRVCEGI